MTIPLFRRARSRGGSAGGDDSSNLLQGVLIGAGVVLAGVAVAITVGVPGGGLGPGNDSPAGNGTSAPPTADAPTTTATETTTADAGSPEAVTTTPATTATGAETPTATAVGTEVPAEPTTEVVYRVNAGGPPLAPDGDGPGWSGDTADNPSAYGNAEQSGSRQTNTSDPITLDPSVPSQTPRELFRTGRFDDDDPEASEDDPEMRWSFPVQRGETYVVRLYFAEIWLNAAGSHTNEEWGPRRFDVRIEGEVVLEDYDIYDDVGPDRGTMKEFRVTATDDTLEVMFLHETENPLVSGIEIIRVENATRSEGTATGE